ncbi:class I SAM-dependent methyltransferase [Alteribacter natronophilus]|uniref:class I SAM-dependent methyltransferase n=1 Tax=Alteribacter natronophilus TaxID=2583810 RepID=UPI00110DD8E5|nr:class I SAM-dependent methyltransferase [Alteribacter natronophilus]TMW70962.1 class I SAM-dependent methyltransferase [Alteribacter natronophilus]
MKMFTENMDPYRNPVRYDEDYGSYTRDRALLFEWAEKQGGPVVDLACGTGRTAIPLAEKGFTVTGIDLNEGMLERARQKTAEQNLPVTWSRQDCTDFTVPSPSPFIYMTGNSFQHFLTNESQEQLLQSVRRALTPGGVFIFGTRFPLHEDTGPEEISQYADEEGGRIRLEEKYDPITQLLESLTVRTAEDGTVTRQRITLRYTYPQEMERLLGTCGFTVLHRYGTWEKDPLEAGSWEMIYVCRNA